MSTFYTPNNWPATAATVSTADQQAHSAADSRRYTWCGLAGQDPGSAAKIQYCQEALGPEFTYSGVDASQGYDAARACNVWRPICRWTGYRTGDTATCCASFGQASDLSGRSCPVGTNDPTSAQCLNYWVARCNSEPGLNESNICRAVYAAGGAPRMKPFAIRRCLGPDGKLAGDSWCRQAMLGADVVPEVAAYCNSANGFASSGDFCLNWCTQNDGKCDSTMTQYCNSAVGQQDPRCGCFPSYIAYKQDPNLTRLASAGLVRCATPCTSSNTYLTQSASGITQCCAQFADVNIEQGRALVNAARADVNLSMQCGAEIGTLETKIAQDDQRKAAEAQAAIDAAAQAQAAEQSRARFYMFLMLVLIIAIGGTAALAIGILAYRYIGKDRPSAALNNSTY